ncbi:MAG: hypothetical protein LQ344_002912 [Seirophora lacunosa]|nr:MAG: hypothetical protein LQ344_002912 [Seirophora lacunosa]
MADQDEWSTNANEAVSISFVQPGNTSPVALSTFHPRFTYPIFGEEECIFGYQGLDINLRFAAHDLLPNVSVKYDKKFKTVNDTEALDIEETLKQWMPEASFQDPATYDAQIQQDAAAAMDWKPPGELINSYTSRGRDFQIWSCELTDPAAQQLIDRIQILVSFFIEGGTPIPLDDQDWSLARWKVFFVYEKLSPVPSRRTSPYSLVGYSTTYTFYPHLPSSAPETPAPRETPLTFTLPPSPPFSPSTTLPSRARISQFLILPSHQSHSHGTHLYNTLARTFLSSPTVREITVEDPNEAFDDLRDHCDHARLTRNGTFRQIRFAPSSSSSSPPNIDPKLFARKRGVRVPTAHLLDLPLCHRLRARNKLAPRQFWRLVEMHLLRTGVPEAARRGGTTARLTQRARSKDAGDRAWYYWRLLVKQRIYRKNRDVLMQLERGERVEKVEEAVGEQVADYERLLRRMEERGEGEEEEHGGDDGEGVVGKVGDGGVVGRRERGKRKVVVDDDDEDEGLEGTPEPKKVKGKG